MGAKHMRAAAVAALVVMVLSSMATAVPPRRGACCLPNGSCALRTRANCLLQRGQFVGVGRPCTPTACDRFGACTMPNGVCLIRPQAACRRDGGTFGGAGVSCLSLRGGNGNGNPPPDPPPPPPPPPPPHEGACCVSTGDGCVVVTPGRCGILGGHYMGDGTPCTTPSCQRPVGGCCLGGATCLTRTQTDCAQDGGLYQGDGTGCAPNMCDPATGACCLADGSCRVEARADCDAHPLSSFLGTGSACALAVCGGTSPGACCRQEGTCEVRTGTECRALEGFFAGPAQVCQSARCDAAPGACCAMGMMMMGPMCSITRPEACPGPGHTWQGPFTVCTPVVCHSMCPCDWDMNGVLTMADLSAFEADFIAGHADFDGDGDTEQDDHDGFMDCWTHMTPGCHGVD